VQLVFIFIFKFLDVILCDENVEHFTLFTNEFLSKLMCLFHSVAVVLVLEDLLFDDCLAKFKLIHAVNEVLLGDVVTGTYHTQTGDRLSPKLLNLHDLIEAKLLIFTQDREVKLFDIFGNFFMFIVLNHVGFTLNFI